MPIYEYQCDGCGQVFELLQKYSDPPPAKHDCGSDQVHRIMSRTTFVLKGDGWYITDYARKDKAKKETACGASCDSGGSSSSSCSNTSCSSGSSSSSSNSSSSTSGSSAGTPAAA